MLTVFELKLAHLAGKLRFIHTAGEQTATIEVLDPDGKLWASTTCLPEDLFRIGEAFSADSQPDGPAAQQPRI